VSGLRLLSAVIPAVVELASAAIGRGGDPSPSVIPAVVGGDPSVRVGTDLDRAGWIPASAGMTEKG